MARITSYGLGQYRFNQNYDYINEIMDTSLEKDSDKMKYCDNNSISASTTYQDILVTLPSYSPSGDQISKNIVQYGQTYYIELTIPQDPEYDTIIDLKLCASKGDNTSAVDFDRFQNIKRFTVPKTAADDNIYSNVLLFEDPTSDSKEIRVALIKDKEECGSRDVYKEKDRYHLKDGSLINNKNATVITQSWKLKKSQKSTITYKFAFSPKFNLEGGYPFLLIETNRQNAWSNMIQWVGDNGNTYYGTTLNKELVEFKLYSVSNLLEGAARGQSQIVSNTGQLTHIAISGHPEQAFTINGEEIKIGQSGFYELNDFTITSLGVIVTDPAVDRFIIDYEYKVVN